MVLPGELQNQFLSGMHREVNRLHLWDILAIMEDVYWSGVEEVIERYLLLLRGLTVNCAFVALGTPRKIVPLLSRTFEGSDIG
jgi:hypothetical protein